MLRVSLTILSFAAWLAAASAQPAEAQWRLCSKPSTSAATSADSTDVELRVETSLNFDRLVLTGPVPGEAILRPDGSNGETGSIANVGPRAMVATVTVHGEAGRLLRIDVP